MKKVLRDKEFVVTKNRCFKTVIEHCSRLVRKGQDGTWITPKMIKAYCALFDKGFAKSYEVWQDNELVGGLYGIDLGHIFCGESMFSLVSNASKVAFIQMVRDFGEKGYTLIDCQVYTSHLESLGAQEIPRDDFAKALKRKI